MNQQMEDTIRDFALGLFPVGCKFFNKDGSLSPGGNLLAAIILDKSTKGEKVSPCKGCSWFKECQKEGTGKPREDRLNTEDLETRPSTKDELMQIAQILMLPFDDTTDWAFNPDEGYDPDVKEEKVELPWIARMIRKRITGEGLKIQVTKKAYFIICVLTQGNPGRAMFTLHKIGNFFEKTKAQKWLVTSLVLTTSIFPFGFPTEAAFNKWWDGQKMKQQGWSDNKVDIFPSDWKIIPATS